MNFYVLRPREDLPDNKQENPWIKWYDKTFGFVIKADSEEKARKIAQKHAHSETTFMDKNGNRSYKNSVWTEEKFATCTLLEEYQVDKGIVMQDFARA